jgi:hypothetical protein
MVDGRAPQETVAERVWSTVVQRLDPAAAVAEEPAVS